MAHSVEYILKIATQNTEAINRVAGQTDQLTKKVNGAGVAFRRLGGIIAATFAISKINAFKNEAIAAYEEEAIALTKLTQVMRNTMGATDEQVQRINDLASAQQKLGVVGDETQLAGAQELATYLSLNTSLEQLIPTMNDMLAQQYGLNASQEQAVTIAQMMGKVLDGQTGALSRYGYSFTEAEEKVLKFGKEEQRAAMLAQVVARSVGGVNAALAATPEGKLKQAANEMGDVQERYGKAFNAIKVAMLPLQQQLVGVFSTIADWLDKNGEKIGAVIGGVITTVMGFFEYVGGILARVYEAVSPLLDLFSSLFNTIAQLFTQNSGIITGSITAIITVLGWLAEVVGWVLTPVVSLLQALADGNPIVVALTVATAALAAAMLVSYLITNKQLVANKLGAMWLGVLILKETLLGKAVKAKNMAMMATPWGMIAAGLAGALTLVIKLTNGFSRFGRAQKEITSKAADYYASSRVELDKLYKQLEKTNAGSKERNKLVDELKQLYPSINSQLEKELRQTNDLTSAYTQLASEAKRSALERAKREVLEDASAKLFKQQFAYEQQAAPLRAQFGDDFMSHLNGEWWGILNVAQQGIAKQQELVDKIANSTVFGGVSVSPEPWAPGTVATTNSTGSNGGGAAVSSGIESAVTGGSKSTNITVNIGSVGEGMTINVADMRQGVENMGDIVLDELMRSINIAQSAAV